MQNDLGLITRSELIEMPFSKELKVYISFLETWMVGLRCDQEDFEMVKLVGFFDNEEEDDALKVIRCWIANNVYFNYQRETLRNDPLAYQRFNSRLVDSDEYCFNGYSFYRRPT